MLTLPSTSRCPWTSPPPHPLSPSPFHHGVLGSVPLPYACTCCPWPSPPSPSHHPAVDAPFHHHNHGTMMYARFRYRVHVHAVFGPTGEPQWNVARRVKVRASGTPECPFHPPECGPKIAPSPVSRSAPHPDSAVTLPRRKYARLCVGTEPRRQAFVKMAKPNQVRAIFRLCRLDVDST